MKTVIKIGSSTLTHPSGCVNLRRFRELCRVIADSQNAGHEVILVSSGAIAMGVGKMHLNKRPDDIVGKQAMAAIGQCELMYRYDREFAEYGHTVAQILVTAEDLRDGDRSEKVKNTLLRLISLGVIPIVNENDTVATDEIKIGDNDTLAAAVAASVGAELLILLSDIDGLYDADPHKSCDAKLIPEVFMPNDDIVSLGGGAGSAHGTGGMATKLKAAAMATDAGCDMVIINGAHPEWLYDCLEGRSVGTRFYAKRN